ncbi:hypothetical protein [Streptomyces sp. NRRL B-24484]|uniref:hypothetical protein n=1 Tax=Streptomyces sp. NRRL B-24484 TaxID=1463833 RepID=UPI0004C0C893|nr:hypothetical protein [Streptomyces sp. NRRL B-24484]
MLGEQVGTDIVPGRAPPVTAEQTAAVGLVGAGSDVIEALEDPEEAFALPAELTATGEHSGAEVLGQATHTVLVAALLVLQDAARERNPSLTAEGCLHAARQLALVVFVASLDPEPVRPPAAHSLVGGGSFRRSLRQRAAAVFVLPRRTIGCNCRPSAVVGGLWSDAGRGRAAGRRRRWAF